MDSPLADCTGALIAGGRGTRLGGISKALLATGGETIAARTVSLFRSVFAEVLVVANDPEPWASLGVRVERDRVPGKGAPGGLHTALAEAATPWVFTAACDMPFVSERAIRFLATLRGPEWNAVVPMWNATAQPLHALWRRAAVLATVEQLLAHGDPSLQRIVRAAGARLIPESAWDAVDPGGRSLENANTPGDLARLGLVPPSSRG